MRRERGRSAANTSPKKNIKNSPVRRLPSHFRVLFLLATVFFAPIGGRASQLNVPPQATEAIQLMYSGNSDQAIVLARNLEAAGPEHPLGFLMEADGRGGQCC